ncbi:EamA family transporter [Sulfitobacter porphyrae]|uniref:EamA family transporter n=1 Tax=Sulfitobacter porphyrae TaxID=1246864 RepID=A0ABW2B8E7_9RHOB|nr:transporter [Sulfitobacter porphyrae]
MEIRISPPSQALRGFASSPPGLLLVVGSLLAVSVLLSKTAAGLHAPMLTYLAMAMGGSGLVLMTLTGGVRVGTAGAFAVTFYSLGAGGLMALGSAVGYLTVHEVGAAFIALALAFPPLFTWLLSLILRLERFDAIRLLGLLMGLAGGVFLALGKGVSTSSDMGAVLVACAMPIILAAGNVFRTRYWPKGASPRELAGAMLICGALLTLPFAMYLEGAWAFLDIFQSDMLIVFAIAVVTFVSQYVALFRLQQVAGPVYLSQIGSVAAIVGSPVAVLVLGEHLPDGFVLAAFLIGLGLSIFQYRAVTRH